MPSHPLKWRSRPLTDGVNRAPARAMLRATGVTDDDLQRPLIGVANTWIDIGPCKRRRARGEWGWGPTSMEKR